MLDKSVPYARIYMCRRAGTPLLIFPLPDGFRYTYYEDGDETHWARIEASVLEFDSEFAALLYFKEKYLPYFDALYTRCVFIENAVGDKVATAAARWDMIGGVRRPWLHWVAVCPQYQGLGLGKALASFMTGIMMEFEGDADFYLHTQTWSYKAVNIYKKLGYEILKDKAFYGSVCKKWKKAERILKRIEKKRRKPPE